MMKRKKNSSNTLHMYPSVLWIQIAASGKVSNGNYFYQIGDVSYHGTQSSSTTRIMEAVVCSTRLLRNTELHIFYNRNTTPRVQREAERDLRV